MPLKVFCGILSQLRSMLSYKGKIIHSGISPKMQCLYCLLSSVAPWFGPMVDTEGKIFKI